MTSVVISFKLFEPIGNTSVTQYMTSVLVFLAFGCYIGRSVSRTDFNKKTPHPPLFHFSFCFRFLYDLSIERMASITVWIVVAVSRLRLI